MLPVRILASTLFQKKYNSIICNFIAKQKAIFFEFGRKSLLLHLQSDRYIISSWSGFFKYPGAVSTTASGNFPAEE